ncbi:MAG: SprT family zinc-dependent metalloprotease [Pseudomonadota bacterium]
MSKRVPSTKPLRATHPSKSHAQLHIDYLDIDGRRVPVTALHNPRARRIIVRVDLAAGSVQVTSPTKRAMGQALAFAQEQRAWIAERLEHVPTPVPFVAGAEIPYHGRMHLIRHVPRSLALAAGQGPVWRRGSGETGGMPEICVSGDIGFTERRVTDWLKARARDELNERALFHASVFDVRPARITMRDQTSRWGSCSPSRALSFSWRLIMAPSHVLDYVAAHEVAHLRHMNHGRHFWALVEKALPNYKTATHWLEVNGPGLHRYGANPFNIEDDEAD